MLRRLRNPRMIVGIVGVVVVAVVPILTSLVLGALEFSLKVLWEVRLSFF